jgi:zinc protease
MDNMMKKYLLPICLPTLSCSSKPTQPADVPASTAATGAQFKLRPLEEKTLANGLRVIYIEDQTLPRIGFHLMIKAGAGQDTPGKEGLSAMTASLLEQGTAKRSAPLVADAFAQLGSSFNETVGSDYVMFSTAGLANHQSQLLGLFAEVVLSPAFSNREIERMRARVLAELAQMQDQPQSYADLLFDKTLFPKHPYGMPISGTISSVKALNRNDIMKNYFAHYRPNDAILAVSGNFKPSIKQKVQEVFGGWKRAKIKTAKIPEPAAVQETELKLFSKPGLQQTQVRLGHLGIARSNPDFLKLRLANLILGGAFASRLNQKVRDDLGLTYSISSHLDTKKETGSFEISTFSRNEKAGEAISSTLNVVKDFAANGVSEKELDAAKALLIGQFPAAIETVDRLAVNLLLLREFGIPDTYLTNFFSNVNEITLADVNTVIKKYFSAEKLKIVVFADEDQVLPQLKKISAVTVEKVTAEK